MRPLRRKVGKCRLLLQTRNFHARGDLPMAISQQYVCKEFAAEAVTRWGRQDSRCWSLAPESRTPYELGTGRPGFLATDTREACPAPVVLVPSESVASRGGQRVVSLVCDGKAVARPVVLGTGRQGQT